MLHFARILPPVISLAVATLRNPGPSSPSANPLFAHIFQTSTTSTQQQEPLRQTGRQSRHQAPPSLAIQKEVELHASAPPTAISGAEETAYPLRLNTRHAAVDVRAAACTSTSSLPGWSGLAHG
ncbi:hypothetical protein DFH27DRAFT_365093 [Peziza echinospora]|nr:hypothetical protein DFH27DRAFT_365093 [Peziza echinospora]